jgi:hypothetical protein
MQFHNDLMKIKVIALFLIAILFASVLVGFISSAHATLNSISSRPAPVVTTIDKATITLTPPVSKSPGAWSVEITDQRVATANGLTVTLKTVGSTVIRYVQAATTQYKSVSDFSRLTINPGTPTLGAFTDRTVNLSQNAIMLTPPTSNSDGQWSYESLNTDIATISGSIVNLRDGGTVQIKATQAATSRWLSASRTMTLTINAPAPVLGTFSDITLSIDSVSRVQLTMPSSTSRGTWTLASSDPSIVGIDGLNLTALKAGTATITARQAPAGGFRSTTTSMKVTIAAVTPNTTIGAYRDFTVDLDIGSTKIVPFTSPTSNSPAAWTFTSSDPRTATVVGLALNALRPGVITLSATKPASGNFAAVGPIDIKVTIRGNQQLAKPASITKLVGDPAVKIAYPTSLSSGTWSATSSAPTIVATTNGNLTFEGAGRATITLTQSATETYTASSVTFDVTVIGPAPTLGIFQPLTVNVGQKLTTPVTPQSQSAGRWIFSSSDPAIASVVDNTITGVKVGTATISAYQEPAGRYGQSQTVQTTITVNAAPVVTPTPTPKPTPSPTPTPTVTSTTEPKATAFARNRIITVGVTNAAGKKVVVKINGGAARVGENTVRPGNRVVTVEVDGKLILNQIFLIG